MYPSLCRVIFGVAACVTVSLAASLPSWANCIAHQPRNMEFVPPKDLPMKWDCVTAGPLYEHTRKWYIVTFKVTNEGPRRTEALKLQANIVDTFGDVMLSVPITDNANLGRGDSNGAVFAFHPPFSPNSIDHVNFYVLAVKFADGSIWKSADTPKTGPIASGQVALQRFPMRWDTYDIGSEIAPSPSPYPSRTPR